MEKAHSPYNKESSTSSSNSDFHRHNSHSHSHHHHNHTSSGNNSSNNNYNNINRDKSRKSSISPSNLSVKSDDGRCKSKSSHHHHSHYHNHHQQHSHPQTSTTVANGTGNYNHGSKTSSSSGHYSPSGSATNNSNTSNTVPNNGPLTKNVGVGSNLSTTTTSGRHSSASVSVGHGTMGSINGPATVSISTGLNNGLNGNLISPGSNNSNSSCGSGFGSNGNLSNSNGNNNGSGRNSNTAGALNLNRETSVGSQRHPSPVIQSHSPSLIPSTILPELLQAHAAAAAGTLGGQSGGGSSCTTSSSTSSSSSNNNNNIASSSRGPTAVALAAGGTISNPNSTTKVVGNQPTSPVRQGIPLRHQRGEMINGSSSTTSKIVSQNVNGTLALTGIPRTDSELQLFRVLQRANLLTYFDVMIELGGDDVQQLYEAGVDEFLEIMTLIGMAHKPLHVRRLQKALQEWMSNPALFQTPVLPPGVFGQNPHGSGMLTPSPPLAITARPTPLAITSGPNQSIMPIPVTSASLPTSSHTNQSNMGTNLPIRPIPYHSVPSAAAAMAAAAAAQQAMFLSPSEMKSLQNKLQVMTNGQGGSGGRSNSNSPNNNGSSSATVVVGSGSSGLGVRNSHLSPNSSSSVGGPTNHSFSNGYHHHPPRSQERLEREIIIEKEAQQQQLQHHIAAMGGNGSLRIPADQINPSHFLEQRIRTTSEPNSPGASESAESGHSLSPVPFLQEMEIQKLSDTAITIIKTLPPYVFEPVVPSKRKFSGDFELIMRLPLNDPRRIDEIRKMSTIYGRADSYSSTHPNKRKFPKPLTMHEVSVNEAAAQLCKHVPALLTRWSELTALAKHVVRDAGLPYSNNNFSISLIQNNNNNNFANHNLKYHKTSQQQNPIELNHIYNNNDHRGEPINGSLGGGFSSKKLRMDNNNGLEIQEYNRPPSNGSDSVQMDIHDNAMQITPIRNLPRRSPSDDHNPLPLELVTVTTSSPRRSSDSGSPPSSLRRSTESDDLMNGFKISSHSPSVKITSIPVNGINHDSNNGSSSPLKLLPIKTEPAN